ncbi:MAG: hypothetical protein M3Y37_11625, partial [Chloroflexota bacterium]|nr:hypothetical protein [Chloroflexota bacterium]
MTDVSRNEIRPEPGRALSHRSAAVLVFNVLFAGALALLAWRLGSRPDFAYNWEAYTLRGFFDFVHQPTDDVLTLRDGLMTDSGRSIAVIGPAWIGETLLGTSWLALRLPIALIAALAVPLTWLFGRLLYSDAVGLCGAALVATSPVFLLYGRTATLVGMSLAPALIGFIVLWMA